MTSVLSIRTRWQLRGTYKRLRKLWDEYIELAHEEWTEEAAEKLSTFLEALHSSYDKWAEKTNGVEFDKIIGDCSEILSEIFDVVDQTIDKVEEGDSIQTITVQITDKALSILDLILHEEKYIRHVKNTPKLLTQMLGLLDKLRSTESRRLAVQLIGRFGTFGSELGRLDVFKKFAGILESERELTHDVIKSISKFLEKRAVDELPEEGINSRSRGHVRNDSITEKLSSALSSAGKYVGSEFQRVFGSEKTHIRTASVELSTGPPSSRKVEREIALIELRDSAELLESTIRPEQVEEEIVKELITVQGALSALTGAIKEAASEVQIDLIQTIGKILYQHPTNQKEFLSMDGYQRILEVFEQIAEDVEHEKQFVKNAFDLIFVMSIEGSSNNAISNVQGLKMIVKALNFRNVVRVEALKCLHDILAIRPLNIAFLVWFKDEEFECIPALYKILENILPTDIEFGISLCALLNIIGYLMSNFNPFLIIESFLKSYQEYEERNSASFSQIQIIILESVIKHFTDLQARQKELKPEQVSTALILIKSFIESQIWKIKNFENFHTVLSDTPASEIIINTEIQKLSYLLRHSVQYVNAGYFHEEEMFSLIQSAAMIIQKFPERINIQIITILLIQEYIARIPEKISLIIPCLPSKMLMASMRCLLSHPKCIITKLQESLAEIIPELVSTFNRDTLLMLATIFSDYSPGKIKVNEFIKASELRKVLIEGDGNILLSISVDAQIPDIQHNFDRFGFVELFPTFEEEISQIILPTPQFKIPDSCSRATKFNDLIDESPAVVSSFTEVEPTFSEKISSSGISISIPEPTTYKFFTSDSIYELMRFSSNTNFAETVILAIISHPNNLFLISSSSGFYILLELIRSSRDFRFTKLLETLSIFHLSPIEMSHLLDLISIHQKPHEIGDLSIKETDFELSIKLLEVFEKSTIPLLKNTNSFFFFDGKTSLKTLIFDKFPGSKTGFVFNFKFRIEDEDLNGGLFSLYCDTVFLELYCRDGKLWAMIKKKATNPTSKEIGIVKFNEWHSIRFYQKRDDGIFTLDSQEPINIKMRRMKHFKRDVITYLGCRINSEESIIEPSDFLIGRISSVNFMNGDGEKLCVLEPSKNKEINLNEDCEYLDFVTKFLSGKLLESKLPKTIVPIYIKYENVIDSFITIPFTQSFNSINGVIKMLPFIDFSTTRELTLSSFSNLFVSDDVLRVFTEEGGWNVLAFVFSKSKSNIKLKEIKKLIKISKRSGDYLCLVEPLEIIQICILSLDESIQTRVIRLLTETLMESKENRRFWLYNEGLEKIIEMFHNVSTKNRAVLLSLLPHLSSEFPNSDYFQKIFKYVSMNQDIRGSVKRDLLQKMSEILSFDIRELPPFTGGKADDVVFSLLLPAFSLKDAVRINIINLIRKFIMSSRKFKDKFIQNGIPLLIEILSQYELTPIIVKKLMNLGIGNLNEEVEKTESSGEAIIQIPEVFRELIIHVIDDEDLLLYTLNDILRLLKNPQNRDTLWNQQFIEGIWEIVDEFLEDRNGDMESARQTKPVKLIDKIFRKFINHSLEKKSFNESPIKHLKYDLNFLEFMILVIVGRFNENPHLNEETRENVLTNLPSLLKKFYKGADDSLKIPEYGLHIMNIVNTLVGSNSMETRGIIRSSGLLELRDNAVLSILRVIYFLGSEHHKMLHHIINTFDFGVIANSSKFRDRNGLYLLIAIASNVNEPLRIAISEIIWNNLMIIEENRKIINRLPGGGEIIENSITEWLIEKNVQSRISEHLKSTRTRYIKISKAYDQSIQKSLKSWDTNVQKSTIKLEKYKSDIINKCHKTILEYEKKRSEKLDLIYSIREEMINKGHKFLHEI